MTSVEPHELIRRVADLVPGPTLDLDGLAITGSGSFASAFDVDSAAFASAALANLAFGWPELDRDRVVAMFSGHIELAGEPVPAWADLSGFYASRDGGTIQLHCNFAHHAAGVVRLLGCEPTRDAVQAAVLERDPVELESRLVDAGMIAARVRSLDQWDDHPHAVATVALPLITVEQVGDAAPRPFDRRLRVLDCSRVLAGPIAGQMFAAHGADVLLIGAEHLPSVQVGVLTTGFGKRNAYANLDTVGGRETFERLLAGADVWIDSYRPGSFAARGFAPERCAPGTVIVQLSAFDWTGPWGGRRGFDSIVQSTTGIVDAGTTMSGHDGPIPLPVQALDYSTGLLAAFAGAQLARHQAEVGGTWLARLSLLRTRNWLVSLDPPKRFVPRPAVASHDALHTVTTPFGRMTAALPISGAWPHGPQPLGSSQPTWLQ